MSVGFCQVLFLPQLIWQYVSFFFLNLLHYINSNASLGWISYFPILSLPDSWIRMFCLLGNSVSLLHSVSLRLVDRSWWRSSSSLDPTDNNLMGNQITAWSCWLGNGSSDIFLLRHADTIPTGNLQSGLLWLGREWRISRLLHVKGTSPAGEWSPCFLLLLRRWWQISSLFALLTPSQGIGVVIYFPDWLRRNCGEGRGGGL